MTPEDAERFYEEDEDPAEIMALFDAGRKVIIITGPKWLMWLRRRYVDG